MKKVLQSITFALAALLAASMVPRQSNAFSVVPAYKTRKVSHSKSDIGYTLQMPDFVSGLPKTTWYDVANPTARRIVYDDGPTEFMFASVGNNWPELNEILEEEEEATAEPTPKQPRQPWVRIKLLRRARSLIQRFF
mmetsp:Transcript_10280/g.23355  ORF Transcript_10280/g.23355 Transcript_10280/m.23355 type:complete len:137 (-) Transcript_10280:368-778(-)